jgi:hypothetical protein
LPGGVQCRAGRGGDGRRPAGTMINVLFNTKLEELA